MTALAELVLDMERRLAVADAERDVYAAAGRLGMALRWGIGRRPASAAEISKLEADLAATRERLAESKLAG